MKFDVAAMLDKASKVGASTTRPVLPAGIYKGAFKELKIRMMGLSEKLGTPKPWIMFAASFELDSQEARLIMKSDNNPTVYTDQSSALFDKFFNMTEIGFFIDENPKFWNFVGNMLSSNGTATFDEADKTFKFDPDALGFVYSEEFSEYMNMLNEAIANGTDLPVTKPELNKPEIVPALLVEKLFENWTTLLSTDELKEVCIEIANGTNNLGDKTHYVNNLIYQKDFEKVADQLIG